MKLGVLGDIHGNRVALEAVLRDLAERDIDAIACTGDIVGVAGWPDECVEIIQKHCDHAVVGNHDAYILPEYSYIPQTESQKEEHRLVTSSLTEESVSWLQSLPEVKTITEKTIMAHAHPWKDPKTGIPAENFVDKGDWLSFASEYVDGELVIIGHTHDQGGLNLDKFEGQSGTILNPGAVGMPWDEDARYAIVDTDTHDFELHRTFYPANKIVERLSQLDLTPTGNTRKL